MATESASARWLMGTSQWQLVDVQAPPGPLGVLLDGDELDRPVLEGFAAVSATDPQQRGTVELSGRVVPGSLLVGVDEVDFVTEELSFKDVGEVLRETSHQQRTLRFRVPREMEEIEEESAPLSQQFAPRRGPPPREEEEEESEEEEEEETDEEELGRKQVYQAAPQQEVEDTSNVPLSQQFAPRRGPPPREEEEEEEEDSDEDEEKELRPDNVIFESGSSSAGDSFQEIHMAEVAAGEEVVEAPPVAEHVNDQVSSSGTSWTFTGSKSSSTSSASPQKPQQLSLDEPQQLPTHQPEEFAVDKSKQVLPEKIEPAVPLPTDLSVGAMAAAQTRHFDSDDSSDDDDDDDDDSEKDADVNMQVPGQPVSSESIRVDLNEADLQLVRGSSSLSPEEPQERSPRKTQQSSPVPLSLASNVSSGTIAASLMVQTNQFDRDDSYEDAEDAEYVTAVAPSGPLGLNLDGGVLDHAVVMGFAKLRDGAKGVLERNGDIVPGSVIVRINGEDFSHATLSEVSVRLSELSMQPRTLVFRLPPKQQQEEQQRSAVMKRAPTLPPFEEDFDRRRKMELALVMHYDKTVLARRECWFCVDAQWMARWVDFVARGGPEPGPMSNETLLQPHWRKMLSLDVPGRPDVARDGLVLMKDYRVVGPMVWCLFAELHGLGEAPLLARYLMDVHAEPLSEAEVSNVLEVPRPKATILANNLRDKCLVRPSRLR